MYTITSNLSRNLYDFLSLQSKKHKTTKRDIIEQALQLYQKHQLKQDVQNGLKERFSEYKSLNNEIHNAQRQSIHEIHEN